jgi:hypothetical protein
LKGSIVFGNINVAGFLDLLDYILHDTLVEVLSAQMSVSMTSKNIKGAIVNI